MDKLGITIPDFKTYYENYSNQDTGGIKDGEKYQ